MTYSNPDALDIEAALDAQIATRDIWRKTKPAQIAIGKSNDRLFAWLGEDKIRVQQQQDDSPDYLVAGCRLVLDAAAAAMSAVEPYSEALIEAIALQRKLLGQIPSLRQQNFDTADLEEAAERLAQDQVGFRNYCIESQGSAMTCGKIFDGLAARFRALYPIQGAGPVLPT